MRITKKMVSLKYFYEKLIQIMTTRPIQIYCENNNTTLYVEEGSTLDQVLEMLALRTSSPVVACFADNRMKELNTRIYSPKSLRYVELTSDDGRRVYSRSLFFLLHKAVADLYPGARLRVLYTASRGYYCEIDGAGAIGAEQVEAIKKRMLTLVELNLPIVREKLLMSDVEKLYHGQGYEDKLALLGTRPQYFITVYNLGGLPGYFYGAMTVSTGGIDGVRFACVRGRFRAPDAEAGRLVEGGADEVGTEAVRGVSGEQGVGGYSAYFGCGVAQFAGVGRRGGRDDQGGGGVAGKDFGEDCGYHIGAAS